jgi:hypothetical protein
MIQGGIIDGTNIHRFSIPKKRLEDISRTMQKIPSLICDSIFVEASVSRGRCVGEWLEKRVLYVVREFSG